MTEQTTDRDTALRETFVSLATSAPYHASRWTRKRTAVAIIAFVAGGALAGGAVSTAAFAANTTNNTERLLAYMGESVVGTHGTLLGHPKFYAGTDAAALAFGKAPAGANHIVISFQCDEAGTFTPLMNGLTIPKAGGEMCTSASTDTSSPTGFEIAASGSGAHTLRIDSGGKRYSIWASWVKESPIPKPTADQDNAVADGVITRDEYLAAWNGYLGCMAGQGHPVSNVSQSTNEISTAFAEAGYNADRICYPLEFSEVSSLWGTEHAADETADKNWSNEPYQNTK
jgi:hypothetical protein